MKHIKRIAAGLAVVVLCLGMVLAQAVAKQRDFDGTIKVTVGLKDANGTWTVIDNLNAGGTRFTTSVADLASGKKVSSAFAFSGKTENGHQVGVRLQNAGDAQVDLTTGRLDLKLPVEITVDGKKFNFSLPLTTETASSPIGQLSGKRAVINEAAKSATLKLAGASQLTLPGVTLNKPVAAAKVDQKKEGIIDEKREPLVLTNEQIVLAIDLDGKITAK